MTTGKREMMHHYVYRIAHDMPAIPSGYCVVHRDGDWRNNQPWNLELVPRSESGKYARHNNRLTKGRGHVVVNKFCLHCGRKITGSPAYIKQRQFCTQKCFGDFRKGTKKGLNIEGIKRELAIRALLGGNSMELSR